MRQREAAMLKCGSTSPGKVGAVVSRNPKGALPPALTGVEMLVNLQRTHGNAFVAAQTDLGFRRKSGSAAAGGSRYEGPSDRPSREQAVRSRWCNRLRWVYELGNC